MKVAIVGPGAMGCLFGAFLAKAKEEVWLVDKNEGRADKIRESGIVVEGMSDIKIKINVTSEPKEIGVADLIIICVKSYDTDSAVKAVKEIIGNETAVLTLQNGIGNIQVISELVGQDRVIGGITSQGANVVEPGHIRHAGRGETIIGRVDGRLTGALRNISNVFNRAGFDTRISRDINGLIWSKLIINIGINALTALTRLNNGRLTEYDGTKEVMRQAVYEAVKIAKKKRIKLIYDDPLQKVESVCSATAPNISSMLQDILNKKKTEIDFINGAIVRQSKNLGIPTPVNEALTNLVKTIEASYDKQL